MDSLVTGFFLIVGLVLAGVLVYFFIYVTSYKHKIRIREIAGDRKLISDDKAREIKKDGQIFWQLLKRKIKIPVPPPEVMELDKKGRKCVEAYKLDTGEFIWVKDVNKPIPEEIITIKNAEERKAKIAEWTKENKGIAAFEPLTTAQRGMMINQIKTAQLKKKKDWKELMLPIAGIGALIILVVSLMIFYADMAAPLLQMGDKYNSIETIHKEQLELIKEIKYKIQVIKEEEKGIGPAPD